jgi:hypothetical protein
LRLIQVLQDVRSAVTSSKARISEVKNEELGRAMNNLEQQGAKFNEQQLEKIQSLLNSILSTDRVTWQTIQVNKQPFRQLIIMFILVTALRKTFHQQGRTQQIQSVFDRLTSVGHGALISTLSRPNVRKWSKISNATIEKLRTGLTSAEPRAQEFVQRRQRERSEAEARQAQPPTQTQSQDPEGQGKKSSKTKKKSKTTSRTGLKYKLR